MENPINIVEQKVELSEDVVKDAIAVMQAIPPAQQSLSELGARCEKLVTDWNALKK
jgi:uncharacterized protein YhaN